MGLRSTSATGVTKVGFNRPRIFVPPKKRGKNQAARLRRPLKRTAPSRLDDL